MKAVEKLATEYECALYSPTCVYRQKHLKKYIVLYRIESVLCVYVCEVCNTDCTLILKGRKYLKRQLRKMKNFCNL